MAETTQVSGAVAVYVSYTNLSSGTPQKLGYTRNGVTPLEQSNWLNVPGDQNGGDDGPPIDVQHLGGIAIVRLELTKYDMTVLNYIRRQLDNATLGQPPAAGSLMFTAGLTCRLTLVPTVGGSGIGQPQNFPVAFTRNAIEVGRGSKFSTAIVEYECHRVGENPLFNSSTTGIT